MVNALVLYGIIEFSSTILYILARQTSEFDPRRVPQTIGGVLAYALFLPHILVEIISGAAVALCKVRMPWAR